MDKHYVVEAKEPPRYAPGDDPRIHEENVQRVSLVEAFKEEIELMRQVSDTEKLNESSRKAADIVVYALEHILLRWTENKSISFDNEKLQFNVKDN